MTNFKERLVQISNDLTTTINDAIEHLFKTEEITLTVEKSDRFHAHIEDYIKDAFNAAKNSFNSLPTYKTHFRGFYIQSITYDINYGKLQVKSQSFEDLLDSKYLEFEVVPSKMTVVYDYHDFDEYKISFERFRDNMPHGYEIIPVEIVNKTKGE